MSAQVTPGPWMVRNSEHGAHVEPSVAWCGRTSAHSDAETYANAKLIASAPTLLAQRAALEKALREIETLPRGWTGDRKASAALRIARAALAGIEVGK